MIDILAQIPPRARKVVELGCGTGELGEAFLRRQPAADYWGVEADQWQAQAAARRLPHAICAQPEAVDFSKLGEGQADVIVLRHPFLRGLTAEKLKVMAGLLAPEGQLLLVVANSGYIRTVMMRLAARLGEGQALPPLFVWQQMAAEAGLQAEMQTDFDNDGDKELQESAEMKAFLQAFTALCQREKWGVRTNVWARGWVLRLFREPVPFERRLLVHALAGEGLVTAPVRLRQPGAFLSTEPGVQAMEERHNYDFQQDAKFGSVIMLRQRLGYLSLEQCEGLTDYACQRNMLLLSEMDDNPMMFSEEEPPKYHKDYMGVHAVQVSTEPLAEIIRLYNPEVAVFRNELAELPAPRDYRAEALQALGGKDKLEEAPVTVFFGALNRTEEWQDIMPVLNEAIERYGTKLRFKVLSDRSFYEALRTEHKTFYGNDGFCRGQFVPYSVYQQVLHASDISLLPLRDTKFNRTKSDLKFIESAGHGAVVLASPTVYEETVRDGETGFLYRSPQEFAERLQLLVEERDRRLRVAEAAYAYVRAERLLSQHYLERLAWYRELFGRKQELDKALRGRVQALREHARQEERDKHD